VGSWEGWEGAERDRAKQGRRKLLPVNPAFNSSRSCWQKQKICDKVYEVPPHCQYGFAQAIMHPDPAFVGGKAYGATLLACFVLLTFIGEKKLVK